VVYVIKGALYELRLQGPPPTTSFPPGPDLSTTTTTTTTFEEKLVRAGSMMVNEIGSIHQSFTREEGAVLLCIWGGSHFNLPPERYPPGVKFHDAHLN